MADLNEIKDINADLPLTNFPDEIDELESFSDADDEINMAIITYKNLMKQGETAKAEELYEKYSLKKYIVSAYFLNKIQHMIIACERSISSVKKYFSFSTDAPTGTTSQPNGYLWGKVLQAGDYFKKVILKLKENGNYVDIFPRTTADNVLMSETEEETVKDRLENLGNSLNDVIDNKMDKENPVGSGKMLMNVSKTSDNYGTNAVALGDNNSPNGVNSVAIGKDCVIDDQGAIGIGRGLISSSPYQHIGGMYNEEDPNAAYILGGGFSDDNRRNLLTVDGNGNVKANSFNASDDIVYNGGKSLTQQMTNNTTNIQTNTINIKNNSTNIQATQASLANLITNFNNLTTNLNNGCFTIKRIYKNTTYTAGNDGIPHIGLIVFIHATYHCSGIWTLTHFGGEKPTIHEITDAGNYETYIEFSTSINGQFSYSALDSDGNTFSPHVYIIGFA